MIRLMEVVDALDGRKFKYLLPYEQYIIKSTRIVLITSNHTYKVLFSMQERKKEGLSVAQKFTECKNDWEQKPKG